MAAKILPGKNDPDPLKDKQCNLSKTLLESLNLNQSMDKAPANNISKLDYRINQVDNF